MNQKMLQVLALVPAAAAFATTTTHTAVDIGVGTQTGYANVGRREMKVLGHVITTNTTSATIKLQECTTSGGNDGADITGAAFAATSTSFTDLTPLHFQTNKRYVRAITTVVAIGATAGVQPVLDVLVERRST